MNIRRVIGILLIIGGVLGLVYGGFSFTKERHAVQIGEVELGVSEKENVNIPTWLGVIAIAGGAALLVIRSR